MLCEAGKEKPVALATTDVCVLIRFSFDKPSIMKQTLQKRKVWLYYCRSRRFFPPVRGSFAGQAST